MNMAALVSHRHDEQQQYTGHIKDTLLIHKAQEELYRLGCKGTASTMVSMHPTRVGVSIMAKILERLAAYLHPFACPEADREVPQTPPHFPAESWR